MLEMERYVDQTKIWPTTGRHVLANYDDETIVVYQAYCPAIGQYTARHGTFGAGFSYARMSWIKTNFLWMMYRSGWGTKENQEITLALRLRRTFFDSLLTQAVPSTWVRELHSTREEWSDAVRKSSIRLQWDPDHDPSGARLDRRAVQLGLRGSALENFGQRELLDVLDVSDFVAEQRSRVADDPNALFTPRERVYRPADPTVSAKLGLSQ